MQGYTQDNRSIAISDFGLGKDTLLLAAFSGSEFISDLFRFDITVYSENLDISPIDIIGNTATVRIKTESSRVFHGYISDFSFGEVKDGNLREYKMVMVPWFWLLSKNNNHKIFQDKSTKDIVNEIFSSLGLSDFDFQAEGGEVREYCVQHNESDFQFISRLLEEDGIAYHFIHEEDKHTLVLTDQQNAFALCEQSDIEYFNGSKDDQHIYNWEHLHSLRTGKWTLNDYDFKAPTKNATVSTSTLQPFRQSDALEHYEYPGFYESSLGERLVKIRMETEECQRATIKGKGTCVNFYAGGRFNLIKHDAKKEQGGYVLTGVSHQAYEKGYLTTHNDKDNSKQGSHYNNEFACIPEKTPFRPKQRHLRPVMKGSQSAIVVGPEGEEIHTDEYGRIKVQFIWDRTGQHNENSSCFIRVMQVWAGNKWGASFTPRIGHEVIVDFLDGDPDRPIVSGSVYNGKNKPPYESKTQSGIKSRSSKGASTSNYNELRFEDKLGSEQVFLQAEKDYQAQIKNNESASVGANASKNVGANDSLSVGGSHSRSIGSSESITVGTDRTDKVGANTTVSIGANATENIGANLSETVGANRSSVVGANESVNIAGNQSENIGGKKSLNVASKSTEMVGSVKMTTVGAAYMLNVGAVMNEIVAGARLSETGAYSLEAVGGNKTVKIGGDLTISVGGKVTISSGAASIVMEGGNVTIKGGVIDLN